LQDGVYEFHTIVGPNLESDFRKLVIDLKNIGYIPVIGKGKESGSDYIISVIKRRKSKTFGVWINIVLLVATLISTIYVGEGLYAGYFDITKFSWDLYFYGFLYFSLPLLVILGSHEFGHYFMARRSGVSASLPFFMPAPFTLLGTLGAFISLRDPLPDRKTLIKIGAAGPLVGFGMSIVVGIIGAYLGTIQKPVNVTSSQISYLISLPLIYYILPGIQTLNVHPVAFAAWVGFLVTAINLFPIGQLDGGHVARGLLGKNARYFSYAFIIILIVLGIYYVSWILFAILIIILGLNHPPPLNDISKPGRKEIMVGIIAIALVAICFSPVPFAEHVAPNNASVDLSEGNNFALFGNPYFGSDNMVLQINNSNNYVVNLTVAVKVPRGLSSTPSFNESMSPMEKKSYDVSVIPSNNSSLGTYNFTVRVTISSKVWNFARNITVVSLDTNLTANNQNPYYDNSTVMNLTIGNHGHSALLEVYRFNVSSIFYINGTTGTTGTHSFVEVPSNSSVNITALFYTSSMPAGIIFVDRNTHWGALAIFYIPTTSMYYKLII
jgi:membrane-associated protease RseP (regulator of RpoE activity)